MTTNTSEAFAPASKKARLEIIPLIDVIFFLLATFVLFTLSLNKIKSIDVNLPIPVIAPGEPEKTMLFLQATEGGAYLWKIGDQPNPDLVPASELKPRLQDYVRRVETPRVFIRGDSKAKFGDTVFALDAVRLLEIKQVSVETTTSQTGR